VGPFREKDLPVPAENFENRLTYLVRRVGTPLAHDVDRALRTFALTHAQYGALAQLGLVDPEALSAATMAERNGITAQSTSTAIAGLLERGLVSRAPHPDHGRILQVRITPAGAELLAAAHAATGQAEDRALALLDDGQRRLLREGLQAMMQAMGLYAYSPITAVTEPAAALPGPPSTAWSAWSPQDLERIDAAVELHIAARRADGSLGRWTPIWVVRADQQVYVRTWHRRDTGWYGQVLRSERARIRVPGLETDVVVHDLGAGPAALRAGVDAAYRSKYGTSGSASMVDTAAGATTLRLRPEATPTSP
jgi:DNA-binding MarR family transcriptional regulator